MPAGDATRVIADSFPDLVLERIAYQYFAKPHSVLEVLREQCLAVLRQSGCNDLAVPSAQLIATFDLARSGEGDVDLAQHLGADAAAFLEPQNTQAIHRNGLLQAL